LIGPPAGQIAAMKAMGTQLVYVTTDGDDNVAPAAREELAVRLAEGADNTVFTEQHNNPSNAIGYHSVARELTAALPEGIDYLIGSVGTGGSLCSGWRGDTAQRRWIEIPGHCVR
jgi:cystathionine beta-synthase